MISKQPIQKKTISPSDYYVDFNNPIGTIKMRYGTNEDTTWHYFATDTNYQQYAKEVNTEYIRTWLSAQWYKKYWYNGETPKGWTGSTFPLNEDETYTWNNVDLFVDGVLAVGATPVIVFAHGDRCGSGGSIPAPFDFSDCEANNVPPPSNFNEFTDYAEKVTQHFVDRYGYNEVNTWYFEIMNEPYTTSIWNNFQDYYSLFNLVQSKIKSIVPNAKVGGYAYNGISEALANCDYDFIDMHLYPDNIGASGMDAIDDIYNAIVNAKNEAGDVEIVSGEYNVNTGGYTIDEDFQSKWLVAALIAHIKAGAKMELWYEGTYHGEEAWGLWGVHPVPYKLQKAHYNKKQFTEINPVGSTIFNDNSDTNNFDILAVENTQGKFITIVNKRDETATLNLEIRNLDVDKLVNLETNEQYTVSGNSVSLNFDAYEVKFLEIESDSPDCNTLKSTALSSITTWANNPTQNNKDNAITAIVSWAQNC